MEIQFNNAYIKFKPHVRLSGKGRSYILSQLMMWLYSKIVSLTVMQVLHWKLLAVREIMWYIDPDMKKNISCKSINKNKFISCEQTFKRYQFQFGNLNYDWSILKNDSNEKINWYNLFIYALILMKTICNIIIATFYIDGIIIKILYNSL